MAFIKGGVIERRHFPNHRRTDIAAISKAISHSAFTRVFTALPDTSVIIRKYPNINVE